MDRLRTLLATLGRRHRDWAIDDDVVTLPIGGRADGRHQAVHFEADGPDYLLTSEVLGCLQVTRDNRHWRALALRAWRRNGEKDLVTFTFNDQDDLIGLIRHARAHLDLPELEVSLLALARECDRFEFVLTGADEA